MYKRRATGWIKHLDFIALDLLSLHLAYIFAYAIRHGSAQWVYAVESYRVLAIWLSIFAILTAILFDTMHNVLRRGYGKEAAQTLLQSGLVFALATILLFTMKDSEAISRTTLWVLWGLYAAISYLLRLLYKLLLKKKIRSNAGQREMLLICDPESAVETIRALRSHPEDAIHLQGVVLVGDSAQEGGAAEAGFIQSGNGEKEKGELKGAGESAKRVTIEGVPVVATERDAAMYICREWIDEIYVAVSSQDHTPTELIHLCAEMGVTVHLQLVHLQHFAAQRVERIADQNVLTGSIAMATPAQLLCKRLLDLAGGLVLSLAALIAMAVVGPMIKRASPGPILYKAERIGRNGKKFHMYKIRSMYMDADARKKDYMDQNRVSDGMMFKLDFDPRIIGNEILPDGTRKSGIGQKIRDWSIDELPQGFNILLGSMSLVGTRPPTPDEWEKYQYHHRARLAFKPGLTGMWQVSGRSEITDFEEVTRLDTEYITRWNLSLDLRILFQTIGVVFKRKGAM